MLVGFYGSASNAHAALSGTMPLDQQCFFLDADLTSAQQRLRGSKRGRYQEEHGGRALWRKDQLCYSATGHMLLLNVSSAGHNPAPPLPIPPAFSQPHSSLSLRPLPLPTLPIGHRSHSLNSP